jgi:hypothetical protein
VTTDIFVSYARQDREEVAKLVAFLQAQGWTVWWDPKLQGGDAFDKAIGTALAAARCVIVMWSRHSIESDFVFDEARRAYKRGSALPVLLDTVEIPLGFGRIQAVSCESSADYPKIAEGVANILGQAPKGVTQKEENPKARKWRWWIAVAVVAAGIAGILMFSSRTQYRDLFLASRPGGSSGAAASEVGMVGLTVWVLRPPRESDPAHARMLMEPSPGETASGAQAEMTPVRVRSDQELTDGSKVRLSIESSREGSLYVIDRELHTDDSTGTPKLVFPTASTRGSGNFIAHGGRLELPALGSPAKYWILGQQQSNYAGELITVIVSPRPIAELEGATGQAPVNGESLAAWERDWGAGAREVYSSPGGDLTTAAEANARTDSTSRLTVNDAAPAAIYAVRSKPDAAILASFRLRVAGKR